MTHLSLKILEAKICCLDIFNILKEQKKQEWFLNPGSYPSRVKMIVCF